MAAIPCNQYQDLVAKGRALYTAIVRAVEHHGDTFKPLPEIAPFYYTDVDPPESPAISQDMSEAMANAGHPANNYVFILVHNTLSRSPIKECPYQNYVHTDGKALLCMSNFADRDQMQGQPG